MQIPFFINQSIAKLRVLCRVFFLYPIKQPKNRQPMTGKYLIALAFVALLFWTSCNSNSRIITVNYTVENRDLDTVAVTASRISSFERPVYNPSANRSNDLLHTKLDVSFDWENQYLNGKAVLELKPIFYPTNQLRLDAKGFDIHKVAMIGTEGQIPLQYKYENKN